MRTHKALKGTSLFQCDQIINISCVLLEQTVGETPLSENKERERQREGGRKREGEGGKEREREGEREREIEREREREREEGEMGRAHG